MQVIADGGDLWEFCYFPHNVKQIFDFDVSTCCLSIFVNFVWSDV